MSEFDLNDPIFRFRDNKGQEHELYREELLGKGANGKVYRGLNLNSVTDVAIKVISYRGRRELNIIIRELNLLDHIGCHNKNIICYDSYYKDSRYIFIITELIEDSIELSALQPIADLRYIFLQLAEACQYISQCGMIHLDLKPSNILISKKTMQVKIIDFGMSCLYESALSDLACTKETMCGTPHFISPDIIMQNINMKTDIYSLGWIFFYLVSGKKFRSQLLIELLDDNRLDLDKISRFITNQDNHDKLVLLVIKKILPEFEKYTNLIIDMIAFRPSDRPSYEEIISNVSSL